MNKKKFKKNNGMTLVTVIITIAIMLILTVVTITAVQSNKIISHTQNATKEWETFQKEENKILENYLTKIELKSQEENEKDNREVISTEKSYVGYYADIDGNGTVDGIIYADLAIASSGKWGTNGNGNYKYDKEANLDSYYIEEKIYKENDGFKENQVIAPIDKEEKNDRFYVMALKDFTTNNYTKFYWYYNAYGKMNNYSQTTSADFGKGKSNTATMMNTVYGNGLIDKDLWNNINAEVSKGWFVPSSGEWSAFALAAQEKGMQKSNYEDYGLNDYYWTSSQYDTGTTWRANFYKGYINSNSVGNEYYIRLSTTF